MRSRTHNRRQTQARFKQKRQHSGFALVIALGLMSLIVLLIFSLATLTQVEMATAVQHSAEQKARENARLGLLVALGNLQATAGPDQRITARAEILGDTVRNGARYMTGVWTLENASDFTGTPSVTWLISGDMTPAQLADAVDIEGNATSDNYVVLFGEGSVTPKNNGTLKEVVVGVPKTEIEGQGFYAYYVSDEGVKADFTTFEDDISDITLNDWEVKGSTATFNNLRNQQAIQFQLGGFSFSDVFLDNDFSRFDYDDVDQDDLETKIESIYSTSSAQLLNLPDVPEFKNIVMENAHSISMGNHFVLTNTLDGGLKMDLSHLKRFDPAEPDVQDFLDLAFNTPQSDIISSELVRYMRYHETAGNNITSNIPTNYLNEELTFGTMPLVPELGIMCGLGCRSTTSGITDDVYLVFFMCGDLMNPYTNELNTNNGKGASPSDPKDVAVKVSNLPEITVTNNTNGRSKKLQIPDFEGGLNSWYEHDAGYMRPCFSPLGGDKNQILGEGVIAVKVGDLGFTPDTWDNFTVEFDTSDVNIELQESITNSSSPITFQKITLQNWGDFEIEYDADEENKNNNERFVRGGSAMNRSWLNQNTWTFGFHIKYVDDWVESVAKDGVLQPLDDALTLADLRKREIIIDMDNPDLGDGQFFFAEEPDLLERSNLLLGNDFFQGAEYGSDNNNRIARLFDLPTKEPLSLAAFNSALIFPNGYPRALGNYFNDEALGNLEDENSDNDYDDPDESLNNLFDRYFFSGLPSITSNWDQTSPLPNPRLKLLSAASPNDLNSADTAAYFLLKGGLNINSQDVESWRALLQGRPIKTLYYTTSYGAPREVNNVERAFFNFSFSPNLALENGSYYKYVAQSDSSKLGSSIIADGTHESFIQGIRSLSSTEALNLAQEIVTAHQAWTQDKGRPFESLSEFANSGVIQTAIDRVPSINTPGGKRIPNLAPAHLNAGTVLGQNSNFLFARSDTFTIRAYGESVSEITGDPVSQAYCEAVVQRYPEGQLGNDNRPFKIVSFRWLSDSEI